MLFGHTFASEWTYCGALPQRVEIFPHLDLNIIRPCRALFPEPLPWKDLFHFDINVFISVMKVFCVVSYKFNGREIFLCTIGLVLTNCEHARHKDSII